MTARTTIEATAARADSVQRITTDKGLEIWLVESHAVPLVAMEFAIRGGAAQDPKGRAGLCAMLASTLDEGAGPYDASAFHRAVDDLAIHIGFGADRDYLSGHLRTLSRNLEPAFALLKLALSEPRFDADAIERVRSQYLAMVKRDLNDPETMAARAFREAAFPDHPYGAPAHGDLESLASVRRDDILAMRDRTFGRSSLAIAIVGAIDAATAARLVDDVFAAWSDSAQLAPVSEIRVQGLGQKKIVDLDVPQTAIRFGRPALDKRDPDYFASVLVNHVLGGGIFTARLFNEVREKRGLAYSVYSHLHAFQRSPMLIGGAATKNERAAESLAVTAEQCRLLGEQGPTDDEVEKARKYLIGSYALRFDTSTKIASQLVALQLEGFSPDYLDERNRAIAAVTAEDAHRAAKRLLGDGELLIAAAGRPTGL